MSFDTQIQLELANLKAQYADPATPRRDLLLLEIQKRQQAIAASSEGSGGASATFYTLVMNADDRSEAYTYADAGTVDERITQIVYSSGSVGRTVTETISYGGAAGNYRPIGKTRVVSMVT